MTTLKLVFSAVVLYLLVDYVGWTRLLDALSQAKWSWLFAMFAWSVAGHLVEAYQMSKILETMDVAVPSLRVFWANTQSTLYSLTLPGDLASSVTKWANLSAATGEKSLVLSAMVYNRLAVVFPVFIWGSLAYFWDTQDQGLNSLGTAVILLGGSSVALFTIFIRSRTLLRSLAHRLSDTFSISLRLREKLFSVVTSLECVQSFNTHAHLQFYLIGTLALLFALVGFKCATISLSIEISLITLAWVEVLLTASRHIPISFANIGIREGVLIFVLVPMGIEASVAVGLGLLLFARVLLLALLGAGYQIALATHFAAWKPVSK